MKFKLIIPVIGVVALILAACKPQVISTCSGCEFVEFEYTESLSIISGFDSTSILVEQPYSDWAQSDSVAPPAVSFSNAQAPDSTIYLKLTVEAGAGSEDARAFHEVGYDGEQFRVWYGSGSRSDFSGKAVSAGIPRPPYFRITDIEIRTPFQKKADVHFNVRFPS